ncbi:MAG: hypothetical protein U0793_27505 [Gemmataceae bacterium]
MKLEMRLRRGGVDDHDVGRRQISMQDALVVHEVQRLAELAQEAGDARQRQASFLPEQLVKRDAGNILLDEERRLGVVGIGVEERNDMRMAQAAEQVDLRLESASAERVRGEAFMHDLDHDRSLVVDVLTEERLGHTARAEQANRLIGAEKERGGGERGVHARQGVEEERLGVGEVSRGDAQP